MHCFRKLLIAPFALVLLTYVSSCGSTAQDFTEENGFTEGIEGPAVNKAGMLYAVNYKEQGTIGEVDKEGNAKIFLKLPEGSIGNGIRFDLDQNMFIADYVLHRVYRVAKNTNSPELYAEHSGMSQPNDLAISDAGFIYLSDPSWADGTGKIWKVSPEREVSLLEENMGTTNGIEVSPDGQYLYVNESIQRKVWRYDLMDNGAIANKTLFFSFSDFGLDGMRCDAMGNLFITRFEKGTVVMLSAEGELIQEFQLKGKKPSNITFGGDDGRDAYITMADRGCIEKIRVPHPGSYFSKVH